MRAAALTLLALLLAACGDGGEKVSGPPPRAPEELRLTGSFTDGGTIPRRFTCDGAGTSPPLSWSRVSARARSLALLVEDPDAPGGTFVHWTLWDIPRSANFFVEGETPKGARQGEASSGKTGWAPPCPPSGTHRYVFTLYELSKPLGLEEGAGPEDVRAAVAKLAIARGTLTGRYGR